MASSSIQMPSSTSPFGCVLRDRNQRESFVSNNAKSGFRKNITELGDHFFPCINVDESPTQTITATMGLSPRHTRFLDRWATRQAQETASTFERETREAEMQALSNSQAVSSKASTFLRETFPALSDTSVVEVDLPNVVGASSLVQMWEARLNRSNTFHLNSTNSSNSTVTVVSGDSRTNSGLSNDDDTNNHVSSSQIDDVQEPPSRGFENADSREEKDEIENANESDQRIKVSDIVKKLTSDETNQHHSRANNNNTTLEQNNVVRLPRIKARFAAFDQHDFLQVGKSPRIRGRQAFNDLLMQMERDRHRELDILVERHAVSRFQQRGRIQAMLRLRFLQRRVAIQEQRHQVSNNSLPRERFNTRVEHGECTVRAEEGSSSTLRLDMAMISSASSQISEDIHQNDQQHVDSTRSSVTYASEVFQEESSSTSDITWQEEASNFEVDNNLETQETEDQHIWDEINETVDEQEADDDDYDNNQQIMGSNYDWFRDICRPRDHWEGRRRAWYQEMLESESNNGEIKQLLERKRVSTCLASDFRQRIDQLMASRLNQQTQTSHREEEEEEEEEDAENEERMGQLMMSFLQRQTHQVGAQEHIEREDNAEEEDEEAEYDEEQEEESSIGNHQYPEAGDYFSQTPSSVQLPLQSPISSSWSSYRNQEGGHDSDIQAAPTPLSFAQSPPSQSYYHQEPRVDTSSMNRRRPSLEMELIYDLRGQMEQLHHEMAELKNTIKSCMGMQLQLQHSFKPEDHSGQVERVEEISVNRGPKKGNCCICYEAKVDSLLYRCGHMCTCLKCAHELQWSSGKCPICRAPIVDVVRAIPHS